MTAARKQAIDVLKRTQSNTNKKISRLKKQGVLVAGSEFDKRLKLNTLAELSTVEIKKQAREMGKFLSRDAQFVAGRQGVPIERMVFERYERASKKRSELVNAHYYKWDDIKLDRRGETLGRIRSKKLATRVDHHGRANPKVASMPWAGAPLEPEDMISNKRAEKLARQLEKKSTKRHFKDVEKANRRILTKMLLELDKSELVQRVNDLTSDQLNFLVYNLNATEHLSIPYEIEKLAEEGNAFAVRKKARGESQFIGVFEKDIDRAIEHIPLSRRS